MNSARLLIGTGNLEKGCLAGKVVVITGAGGGIGFEAARSLVWLGAEAIIAEVDAGKGADAVERLCAEFGSGCATFIASDVGDEASVANLACQAQAGWGGAYAVLNNATVAELGAVKDTDIAGWDRSYRVNLRGPVLLARAFLPGMIEKGRGVFVCVSSSGAAPYMGPYEVMKTAQVELANTLAAELEDSGVTCFTIGPGLVATETFQKAAQQLAPLYGKTVEEFRGMSRAHELSAEAAGAGFAAAIALAGQFSGQETSSIQALGAAGITLPESKADAGQSRPVAPQSEEQVEKALAACRKVIETLREQAAGWSKRSLFERQWVIRGFKKSAGMPVEEWLARLSGLEGCLAAGDGHGARALAVPLERLAGYYDHMYKVADGFLKNPAQRQEQLPTVRGWQQEVEQLLSLM